VACTAEYATWTGPKRKDVARPAKVACLNTWACQRINRFGAVVGRDTGRYAFTFEVDADSEGGSVGIRVAVDHGVQVELVAALVHQRDTDEASGMRGHEVHGFRGDSLSEGDQVAFVFAVFVVDHNDHFAGAQVVQCVFDA